MQVWAASLALFCNSLYFAESRRIRYATSKSRFSILGFKKTRFEVNFEGAFRLIYGRTLRTVQCAFKDKYEKPDFDYNCVED